jgi:hypothetical protein
VRKQSKIVFTIDGDGNIKADGIDFKGEICHDTIKKYLDDLGVAEDTKKKPEFYEAVSRKNSNETKI